MSPPFAGGAGAGGFMSRFGGAARRRRAAAAARPDSLGQRRDRLGLLAHCVGERSQRIEVSVGPARVERGGRLIGQLIGRAHRSASVLGGCPVVGGTARDSSWVSPSAAASIGPVYPSSAAGCASVVEHPVDAVVVTAGVVMEEQQPSDLARLRHLAPRTRACSDRSGGSARTALGV